VREKAASTERGRNRGFYLDKTQNNAPPGRLFPLRALAVRTLREALAAMSSNHRSPPQGLQTKVPRSSALLPGPRAKSRCRQPRRAAAVPCRWRRTPSAWPPWALRPESCPRSCRGTRTDPSPLTTATARPEIQREVTEVCEGAGSLESVAWKTPMHAPGFCDRLSESWTDP